MKLNEAQINANAKLSPRLQRHRLASTFLN